MGHNVLVDYLVLSAVLLALGKGGNDSLLTPDHNEVQHLTTIPVQGLPAGI